MAETTKTTKKKTPAKKEKQEKLVEAIQEKKEETSTTKKKPKEGYYEAVGRRKTAIARVRLTISKKPSFVINEKSLVEFFGSEELVTVANAPLRKIKMMEEVIVTVKAQGGGPRGQAEATRLGIARALITYDPELRLRLKKSGYLKRDPRAKERKKFGLRGARRAPQFSKR